MSSPPPTTSCRFGRRRPPGSRRLAFPTVQDRWETTLSLISGYGRLDDEQLAGHERHARVIALIVDLLTPGTVNAVSLGSAALADIIRLVFVLNGRRYLLEIAWPDEPMPASAIAQVLVSTAPTPPDSRRVLLCLAGYDQDVNSGTPSTGAASVLLLDRTHLEALVCGLFTPSELLDAAFDTAFLAGRPYVPLTDLLVEQPSPALPARMFRPDQLAPPWEVIRATGPGVDAQVVLVGDEGWGQPLGLAMRGSNTLLVTTDQGILELDTGRGTTFWLLRLPNCHGAPLVMPDGSILVLCRGAVLRYRNDTLEPIAGGFTGSAMLLAGPNGESWGLSGTGPIAGAGGGTLALTRLGSYAGQQLRFDIDFDAWVRAAGWLAHRRFFLAAGGHSAVVDLSRSTIVKQTDWIASSHHYAGHLLVVDPNTVITAAPDGSGIDVTLSFTDVPERSHDLAARLAINGICGFAPTGDGRAYILADVRGNDPQPVPILLRLSGLLRPTVEQPDPIPTRRIYVNEPPDAYRGVRDTASGRRRDYSLDHRPIERGGQAQVFGATHKPTGTRVAFKKLTGRNRDALARMRREIDIGRRLGEQPHVMPVLDHSSSHDWFVMPLADGTAETLLLDDLAEPEQLQTMVTAVCAALCAAHGHDWVHRDVKPANVLKLAGRWVLADWGQVRHPRGHTTDPNRTRTGVPLGTEGFAAPELSINAHQASPAADIYSVGQLIGWAMLRKWPQANIPLIPPTDPWHEIVKAATQHDAARRPATIEAFLTLIQQHI